MPGRNGSTGDYRYGFQGQEKDDEVKGEGNSINYKYRMHDPRIGRFFAVDPLAPDYPHNGPYNFSENMVIHAIELEGLEAFFIHGTTSSPDRWNDKSVKTLGNLTNNKTYSRKFSWEDLDGLLNNSHDRYKAAKKLVEYVKANRVDGEDVTLIGHSHGGNVAIQAAKLYYEETGEKVNLITVATPTYESNEKKLMEDPGTKLGQKAINDHIHVYNKIDGVQGELAGDETYESSPKTKNVEVDVNEFYRNKIKRNDFTNPGMSRYDNDTMGAHSFDVDHPETIENTEIKKLKPVDKN